MSSSAYHRVPGPAMDHIDLGDMRPTYHDPIAAAPNMPPHTTQPPLPPPYAPQPMFDVPPDPGNPWIPGGWSRFPFLGASALLGSLVTTAASMIILCTSDGKPISEWGSGIQPNLYLAFMSVVGNALLILALGQGITISFWRKAIDGATLPEIHRYWESGHSIMGAFRGLFHGHAKVCAVACVLASLSVLRSPLNQKATIVREDVAFSQAGTMRVRVASNLPEGYAGLTVYSRALSSTTSRLTTNFSVVLKEYSLRSDVTASHSECGDECSATVHGFGFNVNCTQSLNSTYFLPANSSGSTQYTGFDSGVGISYVTPISSGLSYLAGLELRAVYRTGKSSFNETMNHRCILTGGLVTYPVIFSNGTVKLRSQDWRDSQFLSPYNLTGPSTRTASATVVGGFQFAADYLFKSSAVFMFGGAVSAWQFSGSLANQYVKPLLNSTDYGVWQGVNGWTDPMDEMINTVREIAFRASFKAVEQNSTLANSTDSVTFDSVTHRSIYVTQYRYMIAAAVISFLGALSVIPLYRRWWSLGRNCSMSPLEIARAFNAPILNDTHWNSTASELVSQVKDRKVVYGEHKNLPTEGDLRERIPRSDLEVKTPMSMVNPESRQFHH